MRQGSRRVGRRGRRFGSVGGDGQREVEQALGVVVGRAQYLAARHVLEGGGDAPFGHHLRGVERLGIAEAWQGRPVGA